MRRETMDDGDKKMRRQSRAKNGRWGKKGSRWGDGECVEKPTFSHIDLC